MGKSKEKKSFKLFNDYIKHFNLMTDEDAGKTIKAVFAFVNSEEFKEPDGAAGMAFSFIKSQLMRDMEAYDRKCETNRRNGALGGRPAKKDIPSEDEQTEITETQENLKEPNGSAGLQEQEEKKPKKPKRIAYSDEFQEFWKIYPRAVDKAKAYDRYNARIKDGYAKEMLLQAAEAYRADMERKRQPKEFILHPETFLGPKGRFLDYLSGGEGMRKDPRGGYEEVDFSQFVQEA